MGHWFNLLVFVSYVPITEVPYQSQTRLKTDFKTPQRNEAAPNPPEPHTNSKELHSTRTLSFVTLPRLIHHHYSFESQPRQSLPPDFIALNMATLLSLPDEILVEIIEDTRPDSIRSFVKCCKSMWVLGARVLQQHQQDMDRFEDSKIELVFPMSRRGAITHPYTFLSDILLKPRRALYVKKLLVQDDKVVDYAFYQSLRATHSELVSVMVDEPCGLLFRGIVECPYIHHNAISEWVASVRRGDTYEAACLALTLLPNLEVLSLKNWESKRYAQLIFEILKTNQSPHCKILEPLPLRKLHTVITYNARNYSQPFEDSGIHEMCMMIPSLRKLHAKRTVCDFDHWPSGDEFPIESNVTDIAIEESSISDESFARLFSRTKCLQRLTYGFWNWSHGHGDHTAMSFKETLAQYAAHTLTHLELDFGMGMGTFLRFVGSLRQLQTLKHLRIQGNMFQQHLNWPEETSIVDILPFLPASIETLTLLPQDEDPTTTYTLNELPKKREECVPNLSKIACESSFPFGDEMFDDCARVGVELVYT